MNRVETFNEQRPLLFSIAYRMLGSNMDAEDMVQEAFVRWHQAPEEEIQSSRAYLSAIVTRLCIDYLRSARVRREAYIGPWLPEPLLTEEMPDMTKTVELAESLSLAFLRVLETLSPIERAVFLLRQVFDYEYSEIAEIVDKSEANCRQIVRRAQQHINQRRPRFEVSKEHKREMTQRFMRAIGSGDMEGLLTMLTDDIVSYSDGGGKVSAARNPVVGANNVARLFIGLNHKTPPGSVFRLREFNGNWCIVTYVNSKPFNVVELDIIGERIRAVDIVSNPDKLQHVAPL